ncbi:MAG TPA: LysM domain-containing protein [Alphaproteobacteria bacterium]|nr:LysM domain-containing protein [Alphaproteobacteria bacterium]
MNDPVQALFQAGALKTTLFPPTSRYHGIDTATLTMADGRTVVYLRRRFVPPPERFALLQEHTVSQGDRLDNLAAQYLGDPEQFWRLCDANAAMHPEELTDTVGRTLRVTLPEGIPGAPNA